MNAQEARLMSEQFATENKDSEHKEIEKARVYILKRMHRSIQESAEKGDFEAHEEFPFVDDSSFVHACVLVRQNLEDEGYRAIYNRFKKSGSFKIYW